jgi:hypothetical protein
MPKVAKQYQSAAFVVLFCAISVAQQNPIGVSLSDLTQHPKKFDGLLVRVRASLVFGWEGDNWLIDPSQSYEEAERNHTLVWFHCKPERDLQIYGPIKPAQRRRVFGSYTGYFHFVRKTQIMSGAFDPGPFQFDAVEVSIPELQPQ